ncbi:MAG TPA: methyltransferase domain-containing protein, partial [Thermoanaerobaculia bacterium]|nr:methyltransferase domain-containing protein [Thermoanaerobaculia bacterium]
LVRLARRALKPGGVLILETPNPLSVVVASRNFWRDPTHLRPIHPETLEWLYRDAGFEPVERLELRPFGADERLPELPTSNLPESERALAQAINELRDRLDDLLFGAQDYAIVGTRPE